MEILSLDSLETSPPETEYSTFLESFLSDVAAGATYLPCSTLSASVVAD